MCIERWIKPLLFVWIAICLAALIALFWPSHEQASVPSKAANPAHPGASTFEKSKSAAASEAEKPAAMENPSTYASVRLQQMKSAPARWNEPSSWREEFSVADRPELQLEVLGLARQIGSEALLAVLPQALDSADPLVRLDAARSIELLAEKNLLEGVMIGVMASDPDIRSEVMDVVARCPAKLKPDILRETLHAAAVDVRERSLSLLIEQPTPELFSVLLEGMQSEDQAFRSSVGEAIAQTVQQHFRDYTDATKWWTANRERFDEMMLQMR